ncbi:MAG: UDP-N-acetylmuramoyl-tripeptide--D-alanyl-D-alanine ligase [Patescibacteria group bacterium]
MKDFFITILAWKIKKLAQLTIWRYRPGIVGVTGSVGKTSTKMAIAAVLGAERRVRFSKGNFNNELGLPLTILGDWDDIKGVFFWPKVICVAITNLIVKREYPEILILEYAIQRPGDMKYLLGIARPNISVITAIGEIPAHVEFFGSPEEVAREKGRLIEYLPSTGFAVLNRDDATVTAIQSKTRAHLMTFGFSREAEVRITNFENRSHDDCPLGIGFKLQYAGSFVPVTLNGVFGKAQAYSAAAAAAVGLIFGLNLVKISEALKSYRVTGGRMELVPGVKYTYIINDSYNASPLSMHAALDTLKSLPAKRRIAVLGDMLEIGAYSLEAHQFIGEVAADIVDILVTVGSRAKFIAEGAKEKGMAKKNILTFDLAEEAQRPLQALIKKGDIILIKGSRAMELEKVVEEIRAF